MTWLGAEDNTEDNLPLKYKFDKYDDAIEKLQAITFMLYGGYYEPRSQRDYDLAHKVAELIISELSKDNQSAV